MNPLISIRGLRKRFRHTDALADVNLDIPEGKVTAFLGPNGAGKTTTIKCAMNLVDRDGGEVRVLDVDARDLKSDQWMRIGYVSENQQLPGWLTVPQLLDYVRPMYGTHWDRAFEKRLLSGFELPLATKIRSLSRGQRMKAALLSSLAYRPQLVVLDEPFSGLDPLVRDEFLEGLLELTGHEGWTVWISSHDIEEVERFADRVAFLNDGRVELEEDGEALKARFREVDVSFDGEPVLPPDLPAGWLNIRSAGRSVRFVESYYEESSIRERVAAVFPQAVRHEVRPMSLREIFVALAKSHRAKRLALS